uniref:Palmitoyl-protein thioesterase 1 n=1 Tax=Euplotes crassus TaxID=5936 RepID=A0A7S3KB39_EUPCR|mmetsp:Transcript_18169/g.17866  ORF Transcript_18169/g.17866 Transcript_18169/m.17866 type:complete len:227 (+) Transcript_18169:176-856(+)
MASIFYNINYQGKILCDKIHQDEQLKDGNFSILGISQGAVISKYIIEYCPLKHPVRSIVTFGGPHMGVSFAPTFPKETWLGTALAWIINKFVYFNFMQYLVAPADFWIDPTNPQGYLKHSRFLAEANNERNFDQNRKDLWLALKHARFVKWEQDTTIIPRESSWWGMYSPDYNIVSRFDTEVYKKDLIGIRTLEEEGRADFISIPGDHMKFSHDQINNIVRPVFTQ